MKLFESLMAEAESTTTTSAGNSAPAAATPPGEAAGSAPVDTRGEGEGEDWGGELSHDDDGATAPSGRPEPKPAMKSTPAAQPAAEPKPAAPAPQAATPPAQQPAAPKPGEQQPAAQPAAQQPAQQPAAAQPQAKPAEPVATETPEAKAAREKAERETREKKALDDLVKYYKLPDEWAAQLPTEPELVLPQLAARLHQAVMNGVNEMISQSVPQVVHGLMETQRRDTEAREMFYSRWPSLRQYEAQVMQAGALFGQLNPKATPEERIERIGRIVSESLGIPIAPVPGAAPTGGTPPPPPAPVHRPAGVGGSAPGGAPAPANEFEEIAEQLAASGD